MSVRGERIVYRERSRERDWDEPRRSYTTVKRYAVPERRPWEEDEAEEKKIVIRRSERSEAPAPPSPKREERDRTEIDIHIRDRDSHAPARSVYRDDDVKSHVSERFLERDREDIRRDISYRVIDREDDTFVRDRSRSELREGDRTAARGTSRDTRIEEFEFRRERERDHSPGGRRETIVRQADDGSLYEVQRYTKNTEYFQQPQPIVIRESSPRSPQPIIIREERREPNTQTIIIREREREREPNYEFVEREETKEKEMSVVKREETPPPEPVKEQPQDYYYERRVREYEPRHPPDRRRSRRRDDERHSDDERWERRSVRPRDSASQYSDDSYEYVSRTRTVEENGRSRSPHHKRHLAEGAIAGIGAAEILRHHKKSKGESPGGRGRSIVGGAAVGALGAEALSRVSRSLRRGSRSRSRSSDYSHRRRRRRHSRSRSRSHSRSRTHQLGSLAAIAAVGAIAGYALKKSGSNKETVIVNEGYPPGRSRSRRRRRSVDNSVLERDPSRSALNPEHRNRRIAQAGLASAAAAGIWEKVRSKSRGKSRERSRIRTGVPIAAAGLGGAALAGLYEKKKASKEATREQIVADELSRGRRRRSRSRSRSVPASSRYTDDGRDADHGGMIAYGEGPIYPDAVDHGYYSEEEPASYRRRGSSASSPDTRHRSRSRSKSRGKNLAQAGAAAGVAAVAAHEIGKRNERRRQASRSRSRSRRREDMYENDPAYGPPQYPPQNAEAYPSSNYFPPPPTQPEGYVKNEPEYEPSHNPYPAYNPADWSNQNTQQHQPVYDQSHGQYGQSNTTLGAPYPNDTFAGDVRYENPGAYGQQPGYGQHPGYGEGYGGAARGGRRASHPDDVSSPIEREQPRQGGAASPLEMPPPPQSHASAAQSSQAHQADGLMRDEERPSRFERRSRNEGPSNTANGDLQNPTNDTTEQRPRSTSRVRFDLNNNETFSFEVPQSRDFPSDEETKRKEERRERRRRRREAQDRGDDNDRPRESSRDRDRRRHSTSELSNYQGSDRGPPREPDNRDGYDSDGTVELPSRFDEQGNRKADADADDPLASKIQEMLEGKGGFGGIFRSLMGDRGDSGSESGRRRSDSDRDDRRRRR
ncbi:hypothetical protein K431DRAFT_304592 [Polychaeton citri CBS 116435]|uniref:DUF3824 domain-containing protein n=1 Tax=Polychaeton citri CBS 116435 TaxID=1314669 RepID=A0A9P4Q3T6_9PEZI|nr:hypothetical protein K431DRAFT_304592 [Polychaeton citri CBS 116435]